MPWTKRVHEIRKHIIICQLGIVKIDIEIGSCGWVVEVCHPGQICQGRGSSRVGIVRENGKERFDTFFLVGLFDEEKWELAGLFVSCYLTILRIVIRLFYMNVSECLPRTRTVDTYPRE